jgi:hypothetical protein
MTCHSQVWTESPMLAPVRESYLEDKPLKWNEVYDLPDYAYFNHSIHLSKGISCQTCHGRVDEMPLVWQAQGLTMSWCLDCHRQPEKFVQRPETLFEMTSQPVMDTEGEEAAENLVREYHINSKNLDNCSICHR